MEQKNREDSFGVGAKKEFEYMLESSGVILKLEQGGLCCRKYIDHALNHAHLCNLDNKEYVKTKRNSNFGNVSHIKLTSVSHKIIKKEIH